MGLHRADKGARASQGLVGLAVIGAGCFWLGVAPHLSVRHWTAENGVVQCRQMLNGTRQWSDPALGYSWRPQRSGTTQYC